MQEYKIRVFPEDAGTRIDMFLLEFLKKKQLGYSRTSVQGLIHSGNVRIKGVSLVRAHHKVKPDDEIEVSIGDKKEGALQPENIPLEVVYEDDDLAVINKPSGLVVHPGAGNYEHTLANALMYRFCELSSIDPQRPGIVHRLDKETSGLIVIAKNNSAHLALSEQFAKHSVKRTYIALVKGNVQFDEQVIEVPIGRHPYKRKNMSAGFGKMTRYAKTYYRTLKRTAKYSLLELRPFTGRTHQLRVHLAFVGYPILGDRKYGKGQGLSRLALHAKTIGFIHPRTEKLLEFSSDTPKEFEELLKKS